MIRLLIEFLLPLLAPTLVYSLWLSWERRRAESLPEGAPAPAMRDAPWIWLGALGIVLVLVVAITMSMTRSLGDVGAGDYVAPRNVDGRVVPGHLEPPKR